jgi:hypothetical protein
MTLEELEARVKILEDIEQIKQLHVRYVNYLTTSNWDELLDCFDEDGATEFEEHGEHLVNRGKAAVAKDFKERISKDLVGKEGNFVVHPIISVDGDKAKGSWLLYIQYMPGAKLYSTGEEEEAAAWYQGFYDMEYVKRDGEWKISLLKWTERLVSPRP